MVLFAAVLLVFAVTVGYLQPWGNGEDPVPEAVFCLGPEITKPVQIFRAAETPADGMTEVQFAQRKFYVEKTPFISPEEVDSVEISKLKLDLYLTDYGRDIYFKKSSENVNGYLAFFVGGEALFVVKVTASVELEEGQPITIPLKPNSKPPVLCPEERF